MTTVSMPESLRDKIAEKKRYKQEPLWVVLDRLLGGEIE